MALNVNVAGCGVQSNRSFLVSIVQRVENEYFFI